MKEKLTTLLLAVLVLSSLLLTYQLWYGDQRQGTLNEGTTERVFFEPPRPLDEIITPERILVQTGDHYRLLRYGQEHFALIWGELSLTLQSLAKYEYRARESLERAWLSMEFIFDPLLPVGFGTPWLHSDRYREISKLELWTDGAESWVIMGDAAGEEEMALRLGGQLSSIEDEAILEGLERYVLLTPELLDFLPEEQLNIKGELYVPLPPLAMPELSLHKEEMDRDRLVDAFFVERSLVRKIQEKTGAIIYTDGTKGLRIKQGVEFSNPVQEKSLTPLSYLSALTACNKYICSYGGWPEELRLQALAIDGRERHPLYRAHGECYQDGHPLIGTNQALSLVFSSNGLVEYCRLAYSFQPSIDKFFEIALYSRALEESIAVYYQRHGGALSLILESIELVYVEIGPPDQTVAVPAWLIQINGEQILLQAEDLYLLEGGGA